MSENTEALISALCGNNINTKNYSLCNGLLFDKCRFDQHCDLLHLTNNQVTYILSNMKADIYLNACPGSGKTEVVAIKCAFEMLRWKSKASGMAVLHLLIPQKMKSGKERCHILDIRFNIRIFLVHLQVGYMDMLPIRFSLLW